MSSRIGVAVAHSFLLRPDEFFFCIECIVVNVLFSWFFDLDVHFHNLHIKQRPCRLTIIKGCNPHRTVEKLHSQLEKQASTELHLVKGFTGFTIDSHVHSGNKEVLVDRSIEPRSNGGTIFPSLSRL